MLTINAQFIHGENETFWKTLKKSQINGDKWYVLG